MGRNRLYGIGEPITPRVLRGETTSEDAVGILNEIGVTALREWLGLGSAAPVLLDPQTPNEKVCKAFDKTFDLCNASDIEVTCIGGWFVPPELGIQHSEMPPRDLTTGSPYDKILKATEKQWETLAARFPQVCQWETGNEWNFRLFLHPVGWTPDKMGFSVKEMMLYACDLMYVSARGIRKGNTNAKVVSFSPTPAGEIAEGIPSGYCIANALDTMYRIIENGESFSTKTDDYFDLVAWHPYLSSLMGYREVCTDYPATRIYQTEDLPDALWKSYNDMAYHIMTIHGDGHKKVLLTEFGFSDAGDPEREQYQASLIPKCYELLKQMPYVKTCHFFRLFEEEKSTASENGIFTSESESKFGIVRERFHNYEFRTKAKILQSIYKGSKEV